jgi:hypothetical protein
MGNNKKTNVVVKEILANILEAIPRSKDPK